LANLLREDRLLIALGISSILLPGVRPAIAHRTLWLAAFICTVILSDHELTNTLNLPARATLFDVCFCLFDHKLIQSVVCLIALRQRDHPGFSELIEGVPPKIIARSLAIPLATKALNFLDP
jgi:hypothetical protein